MKKLLFSILCLVSFLSIVNAKTQIEYDWGMFVPSSFMGASLYEDDFFLFHSTEKHLWASYYDRYDMNGNKLSSIERNNNEVFYIFEDVIMSFSLRTDEWYQTIYDGNFNVISKKEFSKDAEDLSWYSYGETEDYYFIGSELFTKDTYEHIDVEAIITNDPSYDSSCKSYTPENIVGCFKNTSIIIEKYFPDTHLPAMYKVVADEKWWLGENEVDDFFFNPNGGGAFTFYNYDTYLYGIVFYDDNGIILNTIEATDKVIPNVFYKDNKIYTLRIYDRKNNNNEDEYYYLLTEYDENFNILSENELVSFESDNKIKLDLNSTSHTEKILVLEDGFLVFTDHYYFDLEDEEDYLTSILPAIQKYSFVYSVDTRGNENGTIEVDKDSSKTGEMIKYNVQPKDGYKLEKVVLTDDSGNTIEIKDSSFVMPSSNVTIEAIFVVDNPNTGVFLKVGIACIITFVCYFFIILKNMKVKKYE
ncbi:MAG: hypothetical protein E7171_00025 [Firmicutes bacterium]|nr:hypothetical protein [Bacillota bacterium]